MKGLSYYTDELKHQILRYCIRFGVHLSNSDKLPNLIALFGCDAICIIILNQYFDISVAEIKNWFQV